MVKVIEPILLTVVVRSLAEARVCIHCHLLVLIPKRIISPKGYKFIQVSINLNRFSFCTRHKLPLTVVSKILDTDTALIERRYEHGSLYSFYLGLKQCVGSPQ